MYLGTEDLSTCTSSIASKEKFQGLCHIRQLLLADRARIAVGVGTQYMLEGLGIEPPRGQDFLHLSRTVLGPNQTPIQ